MVGLLADGSCFHQALRLPFEVRERRFILALEGISPFSTSSPVCEGRAGATKGGRVLARETLKSLELSTSPRQAKERSEDSDGRLDGTGEGERRGVVILRRDAKAGDEKSVLDEALTVDERVGRRLKLGERRCGVALLAGEVENALLERSESIDGRFWRERRRGRRDALGVIEGDEVLVEVGVGLATCCGVDGSFAPSLATRLGSMSGEIIASVLLLGARTGDEGTDARPPPNAAKVESASDELGEGGGMLEVSPSVVSRCSRKTLPLLDCEALLAR